MNNYLVINEDLGNLEIQSPDIWACMEYIEKNKSDGWARNIYLESLDGSLKRGGVYRRTGRKTLLNHRGECND